MKREDIKLNRSYKFKLNRSLAEESPEYSDTYRDLDGVVVIPISFYDNLDICDCQIDGTNDIAEVSFDELEEIPNEPDKINEATVRTDFGEISDEYFEDFTDELKNRATGDISIQLQNDNTIRADSWKLSLIIDPITPANSYITMDPETLNLADPNQFFSDTIKLLSASSELENLWIDFEEVKEFIDIEKYRAE